MASTGRTMRAGRRGPLAASIAVLLLAALVVGCAATPIGVNRVDSRTLHYELTASALTDLEPSAPTRVVLQRLALGELYDDDPEAALRSLHALLEAPLDPDLLFALAELSFLYAEVEDSRRYFLAATVYAYAFLLPGAEGIAPEPFDPRLRVAADLYNLALAEALTKAGRREHLKLKSTTQSLPFGSFEIGFDRSDLIWADHPLRNLQPAAMLEVRGLRNRYRRPGLGAPLVSATRRPLAEHEKQADVRRIPPGIKVPITAFLRIEEPSRGILDGALRGELEFYTPDERDEIEVNGRRIPLEFETTVALAASLEGAAIWDLETSAFFEGDFRLFRRLHFGDEVLMLHPYQRGRIPVVMVHGTASSAARWSELINELENDPELMDRIQIWLFMYNTGNPVSFSAGLLHEKLAEAVSELDPDGVDPALQQMVVIGHSQGGLLTRMTAVSSGDRFWKLVSDRPLDEFELTSEERERTRRSFFYEPLPFVRRLIFVATPHQGSYLTMMAWAGFNPAQLLTRLITLPVIVPIALVKQGVELTQRSDKARVRRASEATSIDQMTPGNPFIETLASLPIAQGVEYHSIIAIKGDGPVEQGDDGVVKYASAHLPGAASEKIVRSGHSTQAEPATIEEIRRILRAHVDAAP